MAPLTWYEIQTGKTAKSARANAAHFNPLFTLCPPKNAGSTKRAAAAANQLAIDSLYNLHPVREGEVMLHTRARSLSAAPGARRVNKYGFDGLAQCSGVARGDNQ